MGSPVAGDGWRLEIIESYRDQAGTTRYRLGKGAAADIALADEDQSAHAGGIERPARGQAQKHLWIGEGKPHQSAKRAEVPANHRQG